VAIAQVSVQTEAHAVAVEHHGMPAESVLMSKPIVVNALDEAIILFPLAICRSLRRQRY